MREKASSDPNMKVFDKWTVSICDGGNDTNGLIYILQDMFYNIKPNTAMNKKQEEIFQRFMQENFPRHKNQY